MSLEKSMQTRPQPFALYVHWPFCLAKCPYCDFNSHVRKAADGQGFAAAIVAEMRWWRRQTGARTLTSIFFGGGTPSLMAPDDVAKIIETACSLWPPDAQLEITLEANPTSSEAEKFKHFRAAGVNRLSLGVQALDDAALKALGREHDVSQALEAVDRAARIFPRFSFDLIYARKNQTAKDWENELRRAAQLAGGHLSLYQLTIEPDTVFALQAAQGKRLQADEDEAAAMFAFTHDYMQSIGLPAYEVSNHARAGEESRHNLSYWHYDDYVGVGAGAHSRVFVNGKKIAACTIKNPSLWRRAVEEKENGLEVWEELSHDTQKEEAFMMGLRLTKGLNKACWREKFGTELEAMLDASALNMAYDHGLVVHDHASFYATKSGMMVLNSLMGRLIGMGS